jgi:uncharacterized lipoprotein YmbA
MKPSAVAGLAAVLAAMSGCLSKPALVPQLFSIDPPAERTASPAPGARVICLRDVEMAPQFDHTDLLYRTREHRLESDPLARFAAPPGAMLTDSVRAHLLNASFIRDVVSRGDPAPVDAIVETRATELSADLTAATDAAALMTLEFVVSPGPESTAPESVFRKQYARRARLSRRTAGALVDAWNLEVADIMHDFLHDLEAFLASAPDGATAHEGSVEKPGSLGR